MHLKISKMNRNKAAFKELLNAPSVQMGFAFVGIVGIAFVALRIRQAIKNKETRTAIGIKGDAEITQARASILAETLFDAMGNMGTNEREITLVHDELAKHSKAILQVHEAFGLKRYSLYGSDVLGVKCNLRQWLQKELSAREFAKWDYLYNKATNE